MTGLLWLGIAFIVGGTFGAIVMAVLASGSERRGNDGRR